MVYTSKIDKKWQEIWDNNKIFEPEITGKEKFYLTAAFPYPNSPQHIGHGRTYTTTDIYARFQRLIGKNVLFPMGFHITGTPIIAMAKRIKEKDESILSIFEKIYGISREQAMELTDPVSLVSHFSREIEMGMKEMGFSIDWRRKFYTFDKMFNKFIEWQFHKLKEKGYLVKGTHPVAWCPSCNGAVSAHDTKGDVDPEIEEITGIFFESNLGKLLITTYRPETIYGATNLWINPDKQYAIYSNEKYGKIILAKKAAELLNFQLDLQFIKDIPAKEILNLKTKNPLTNEELNIYPASFVKDNLGSGIVMSVPAHAPYDYMALKDLNLIEKLSIKQVIENNNAQQIPAKIICEKYKILNQDDPLLEQATKELYKQEAHGGKMLLGDYKGQNVKQIKDKLISDFVNKGFAIKIYVLANSPIYCRCTAQCTVNLVKDQWFINYGDENWKKQVHEHFKTMRILPKKTIVDFLYTIDWLKEKPCTRKVGLGTHFPFDKSQMIEALSDSTIYMSFYTISHKLREFLKNKEDKIDTLLQPDFFDAIYLNKISNRIKEDKELLEITSELKKQFEYWYPLDSRHSGMDLVHNHLTLFIFNHIAIFDKKYWPKQIIANGFVLMDGKKMSKSMGNILPLRKAIKEFGADVIRFSIVAGADLSQDTDFNKNSISGIQSRLNFISNLIEQIKDIEPQQTELENIDKWLLSKLDNMITQSYSFYKELDIRSIGQLLFYSFVNDLNWYIKRKITPNKTILREVFEKWLILISPIMPHFAEEHFEMLGKKHFVEESKFVSTATFPKPANYTDQKIEEGERLIVSLLEDIKHILKIIESKGKKPSNINIYIANENKKRIVDKLIETKDLKSAINLATQIYQSDEKQPVIKLLQKLNKNIMDLRKSELSPEEEKQLFIEAKSFLETELDLTLNILWEHDAQPSAKIKALNSIPSKPSILVE